MIVINKILNVEKRIPVWFGAQREGKEVKRPFVYFERLLDETHEEFIDKNALLFDCCCSSLDQDGRRFNKIYDLGNLSKQASDEGEILVYFEYIAAVVNLYAILCADRN